MSSPLHKRQAPRTNVKAPYWRLSGDGSAKHASLIVTSIVEETRNSVQHLQHSPWKTLLPHGRRIFQTRELFAVFTSALYLTAIKRNRNHSCMSCIKPVCEGSSVLWLLTVRLWPCKRKMIWRSVFRTLKCWPFQQVPLWTRIPESSYILSANDRTAVRDVLFLCVLRMHARYNVNSNPMHVVSTQHVFSEVQSISEKW